MVHWNKKGEENKCANVEIVKRESIEAGVVKRMYTGLYQQGKMNT